MKKKKKGFTLIELLAIIVILAIIAVITVPIILNIIENSKRGAVIDSAYGYKDSINKYYVTELANNPDFSLDGEYTVGDDGSIQNGDSKNYPIPFTGTKPSGGKVTIEDSVVTGACLVIDDYKVELKDGKFTTNGKGDCNGSLVGGPGGELGDEPQKECDQATAVKFDKDASWDDIVKAVKNGQTCGMKVGDTKTVTLTGNEFNNKTFTLRIANMSTDECNNKGDDFSETACGFVLEFVDIITTHQMNGTSTNKGGWKDSEMRKYLNCSKDGKSAVGNGDLECSSMSGTATIYDSLPEPLKNAIIDTRVVSGHGNNSGDNCTTTDKIYLLATAEIWENGSNNQINYDTARDKTRQLDYYAKEPKTTTDSGHRGKAIKKKDDSATSWWLRSADSISSTVFFYAYIDGDWNNSCGSSLTSGVAPAFRIGSQ